jgi:hypothetical protein
LSLSFVDLRSLILTIAVEFNSVDGMTYLVDLTVAALLSPISGQ